LVAHGAAGVRSARMAHGPAGSAHDRWPLAAHGAASARSARMAHGHHARALPGRRSWRGGQRLNGHPMTMRFVAHPTPQLRLHAATPTPRWEQQEGGPHQSSCRGGGNSIAKRNENSIRLEMGSEIGPSAT
jgi:hypothetical protein